MLSEMLRELRHVRDEIGRLRARLDAHVDENGRSSGEIQKEMVKIRQEMAADRIKGETNGVKLGAISSGVALFVAAFVSWLFSKA